MIPHPARSSTNLWREAPGRLSLNDLVREKRDGAVTIGTAEFFEYTDFLTQEIKKIGTRPFFRYTIYPNYFENGVGAGLGTFSNCEFVSPDRIQVDDGSGSATWTSETLEANVSDLPAVVTITWTQNDPGFSLDVEFRTASTEVGLAAAAWETIASGDVLSLQLYYQCMISYVSFRAFAFDTMELAEADSSSAWAIDIPDDSDEYQSYAVDSLDDFDISVYIENLQISGELRLPDQDILDGGSLSLPVSTDFSALISADHTMMLINRDNQYTPRHENFIFAGENDWERKNLKIEFGFNYYNNVGVLTETGLILLYVGNILKWGPIPVSIDSGGYDAGEVEIYSRDAISLFIDQMIGTPDDDGNPDPVVCGQILREATELGDNSLDDPVKDVDYESASILTELSSVDLSGTGNLIELSTIDPYDGLQSLRSYVIAGGYARGWIDLPSTSDNILFKTKIKFVSLQASPGAYNVAFLRIKAGGTDKITLEINSDYRVYLNYSGTRKETDWYVNKNQDVWSDLSIGIYGKNPGLIRISLDGNQILNYDQDGSGNPLDLTSLAIMQKVGLGITQTLAETWDIQYDDSLLYNIFYPGAYYVPGSPYANIGSIFVDGVVKVEKYKGGILQTYSGGKAVDPIDITKIPSQGLVVFSDIANLPSGSVFFMLDKDTNTNPVDAIDAILTAGGRDDLIDSTSFNAAKSARPNDSVGAYFEDMSMADAILAVSKRSLIDVVIAQGKVELRAYNGDAPTTLDWIIDSSVCSGLSVSDDSESKKNKIRTKWGQYDQNTRLSYVAQDSQSIAKLGTFEEEIDYTWGGEVGSDNSTMAKNRADCLLNRLKGSLVLYEDVTVLPWKFIRSEIGDVVRFNIPYFGRPQFMRVMGKNINMSPPYEMTLTLALFPGEA